MFRHLCAILAAYVGVGAYMGVGSAVGATIHQSASPSYPHLPSLTRYVNPFVGTIRDGNTFPGASMPFGMVQWSPDTSAGGLVKPGGYSYGDPIITGFSLTHLSGAGCVAYQNFPFMPTLRRITVPPLPNGSPYSAHFSHRDERASPGYYGVRLATGIRVRLTVTSRTGFGVLSFPAAAHATLLINAGGAAGPKSNLDGAMASAVKVKGRNLVTGWATAGRFCGLHNVYTVHFAAVFNRPFAGFGTWSNRNLHPGARHAAGRRSGAYLTFDTRRVRSVRVKVGLSYVGVRNALDNLRRENGGMSFGRVRKRARVTWNRVLNHVQATGGTLELKKCFYTAVYHTLLHPNVFSDANGQYIGFDRRVHRAHGFTQYANYSGWDIYRSEMQLLALLAPRQTGNMVESLIHDAQQGGWLPRWPLANAYTGEMNGDSADPIIADAYAFGARHFDLQAALRFMVKGAIQPGKGPSGYQERPGLPEYLRHGYLPPIAGGYGSAATTLEYAVDDFAIAQMAKSLGHRRLYRNFMARAQNWRHVFNPATGFVEPRLADGTFPAVFNPASMNGFVEGNAWQYTWMVPQDLPGLFGTMASKRKVVDKLNRFFVRLDAGSNSGPRVKHYWSGNETALEVPWEYDFAGASRRTQTVVRRIVRSQYTAEPGGLPGNDDLGELSSWYVWAALGLYPEIPGVAGFALGSPLLPRTVVHLAGHHDLVILAPRAAPSRPFVASVHVDGRSYGHPWLPFAEVKNGGTLQFHLLAKKRARAR